MRNVSLCHYRIAKFGQLGWVRWGCGLSGAHICTRELLCYTSLAATTGHSVNIKTNIFIMKSFYLTEINILENVAVLLQMLVKSFCKIIKSWERAKYSNGMPLFLSKKKKKNLSLEMVRW